MPNNKEKKKFGIGMLSPLLFNRHFSDRDDEDDDLDDGPLPSGPDAANYGNANISERLKFIMDAVVRDNGEVWNVHSDVWGGKNRYGVVRRFHGDESRQKALKFAKSSTYSKKDKEIPKDIEKLEKDKTSIRKTKMETIDERNYKQEYERYHARPEQKKRRAQRNHARRKMSRMGKVRKGDGKDVHHRNRNTSDNESKNLSVMSKSKNRSLNQ